MLVHKATFGIPLQEQRRKKLLKMPLTILCRGDKWLIFMFAMGISICDDPSSQSDTCVKYRIARVYLLTEKCQRL